jgi:hypothetical protein
MNPDAVNTVDRLINLAGHTEIVKHIPGQIHLRIKPTGILLALDFDLLGLQASIKGILSTDVSGRTMVINYDEKTLPKELWELLIKSHANPKIRQLVRSQLLSLFPKAA